MGKVTKKYSSIKSKISLGLILSLLVFIFWLKFFGLTPKNLILILGIKNPTPVSPLYYLKLAREGTQSIFIMGNEDESYWHLTLAEKRESGAAILKSYKLYNLSQNQLNLAKKYYDLGISEMNAQKNKSDINYLIQKAALVKSKVESLY